MKQEKVTKEELMSIGIGETKRFELTESGKCASVASLVNQLKGDNKGAYKCHCTTEMRKQGVIEVTRVE